MLEVLKKTVPIKLALTGVSAIIAVALLIFLAIKLTSPPLSLLYTNLSQDDAALVTSRLEAMGETYQTSNNGRDVAVAVSKVLQLRMSFAQEGIPSSGNIVGYEIFDKNEALGTSQFIYNVNLVRALEGEIARTISSLNLIESARVHIVLPKKELFTKGGAEPSASVVVKMKGQQTLSKNEVAAISHLVATAVAGLKVENITILDNHGRPLKLAIPEDSTSVITDNAAEFQKTIEEKYRVMLEDLVEKSVGIGKVKANVTAEINFDREIINSEIYDPEGQVIRSRKVSEQNDREQEAGSELSVATNIPAAQGTHPGGAGAGHNNTRTDEVTNYEISKTTTNKISESGRIKKISIAILVDGFYQEKPSEDGKNKDYVYTARSEVELEKIKLLAASAVGLDLKRGDKIEVINMQFSEEFAAVPQPEKPFAWIKSDLDNIVQTVVIGIVIILLVLLVIRPIILRALENRRISAEEQAIQEALMPQQLAEAEEAQKQAQQEMESTTAAMTEEEDISKLLAMSPADRKKVNLIKYINDLVEKHPEEALTVIRNWLHSH